MAKYELTQEQKHFYETNGYLTGFGPIYDEAGVRQLNEGLEELKKFLREDESVNSMVCWERGSRWLHEISSNPKILDCVEGVLGPNFYCFATQFFAKPPHNPKIVVWHQDGYYHPFTPQNRKVTVWLAFTDVDEENGAMCVIPGTHNKGLIKHRKADLSQSYQSLELEEGTYSTDNAVSLNLRAGEISLHHDCIVHGSPANVSDRWRIALTMHYCATEVKCDLEKFPTFQTTLMRGVDEYKHNPVAEIPAEMYGRTNDKLKTHERTSLA